MILKKCSIADAFLWVLRDFSEQLLCTTERLLLKNKCHIQLYSIHHSSANIYHFMFAGFRHSMQHILSYGQNYLYCLYQNYLSCYYLRLWKLFSFPTPSKMTVSLKKMTSEIMLVLCDHWNFGSYMIIGFWS